MSGRFQIGYHKGLDFVLVEFREIYGVVNTLKEIYLLACS